MPAFRSVPTATARACAVGTPHAAVCRAAPRWSLTVQRGDVIAIKRERRHHPGRLRTKYKAGATTMAG